MDEINKLKGDEIVDENELNKLLPTNAFLNANNKGYSGFSKELIGQLLTKAGFVSYNSSIKYILSHVSDMIKAMAIIDTYKNNTK
jgi:hypothetical protein